METSSFQNEKGKSGTLPAPKTELERELKLREGAEEVKNIIDRISHALVAVASDWRITYINQNALLLIDCKHEEVIGKNIWNVFPLPFTSQFSELARRAMASRQYHFAEAYFRSMDRWLETHVFPSDSGATIYFNDITERKKEEIKLSESERRLHSIIQIEPECVKLLGANCELLEMNPAGLAMIEADSFDQVVGQSVLGLVSAEYRDAFVKFTQSVFEGHSGMMEFEMISLKGTSCWIETHAVPLKNAEGKIVSLLGVSRNVTQRKRAEKLYRDIFDNMVTGIYQATPDGVFITANPAMARMFGYDSPEELISSINGTTENNSAGGDRLRIKALLEKYGDAHSIELKLLKKNREVMWVRVNNRAVKDRQGIIQHFEGTLEDITQRKRAERKLTKQFKQLQKTNHELDRFVYSTSHDLRAPLASILGLINIAELEEIPQTQRSYLQLIRNNISRLDGFINDILDYSRNSRTDVNISQINLRKVIAELRERLEPGELKVDIKIDDPVPFYSDASRLEIILNNLFSNAIKFQDSMKDESCITIDAKVTSEKAIIVFSDNGIGIEEKYVGRVFDMFFRATEKAKGSGLGLYIVKETVEKLGGTIVVNSEYGKGTTFKATVPNMANSSRQ